MSHIDVMREAMRAGLMGAIVPVDQPSTVPFVNVQLPDGLSVPWLLTLVPFRRADGDQDVPWGGAQVEIIRGFGNLTDRFTVDYPTRGCRIPLVGSSIQARIAVASPPPPPQLPALVGGFIAPNGLGGPGLVGADALTLTQEETTAPGAVSYLRRPPYATAYRLDGISAQNNFGTAVNRVGLIQRQAPGGGGVQWDRDITVAGTWPFTLATADVNWIHLHPAANGVEVQVDALAPAGWTYNIVWRITI